MHKRKKIIAIIISVALIISAILYSLAYRYLIEREEAPVVDSITTQASSSNSDNNVTYDDWNYSCDDYQISITKKEQGSSNDKITYYIADVTLKNMSSLKSAFAQNKFGRNIVENTSSIAKDNNAVFAINGDYYGFREDGIVIRNGTIYRDISAREGVGFFYDGTMKVYDETKTNANELLSSGAVNTFSFGPSLLKNGESITNFDNVKIDNNVGNRSIQNSNPRTGIGIISPYHYVFVVVDGRSPGYSKGMTLNEFSKLFEDLGCTDAYNIDGGGSSTMYFNGRVVNNPLGKNKEREVSDIIYIN